MIEKLKSFLELALIFLSFLFIVIASFSSKCYIISFVFVKELFLPFLNAKKIKWHYIEITVIAYFVSIPNLGYLACIWVGKSWMMEKKLFYHSSAKSKIKNSAWSDKWRGVFAKFGDVLSSKIMYLKNLINGESDFFVELLYRWKVTSVVVDYYCCY